MQHHAKDPGSESRSFIVNGIEMQGKTGKVIGSYSNHGNNPGKAKHSSALRNPLFDHIKDLRVSKGAEITQLIPFSRNNLSRDTPHDLLQRNNP